jgi:PST family polysaccharide transporter
VIAVVSRILRGRMARNALSLYAVQGLNFLMPLILLPYMLRILTPDGYGSIVFAQAFMGYAIMLTDFGFNMTATRDISVARDNPQQVAKVYWTTMAAKAVLLLLSAVIICITVAALPRLRKDSDVFAICGLLLIGSAIFPGWYFQGLERLREVAVVQAISKCVITAGMFIFVKSSHDKLLAAFLMSAPQLVGMGIALILRFPAAPITFYRPTSADVRGALKGSSDMFFATASTSLYLYTNTFILGLMAGERAVAFYSVGNRLVIAVQSLTSPITQAIFPRASMLFSTRPDEAWQLVRRVSWLLFPLMGVASLVMVIFAPFIVSLFGGTTYAPASSVMRIMAPVPLLITAASLLAQTIMVNIGFTRYLWRVYIAVGLLNLVTLPPLVHFFAANGAAVSLTMSELLGPVLMLWILWRKDALPRTVTPLNSETL